MAFTAIPSTDIEVGKPTKKSLWQKIKDNFDDLDTRVAALSAGANKVVVFEYYIDPKDLDIGKIVPADMTLAEYQTIHGAGWVLCDGGSCTGSVYASVTSHTVVPDLRGEFIRGNDDGKGTDSGRVLGSFQADQMESHTHTQRALQSSGGGLPTVAYFSDGLNFRNAGETAAQGGTDNSSENRPRNISLNFFIKINLSAQDSVVRTKAREALTITSVLGYIVDNNGLPTSGNMELDIKKGATIGALSTVYSTKPILAYSGGIADGDATSTGTVINGTSYDISAGDWLQLDVTSMMVGQSGIFIQVFGEVA